MYPMNRQGPGAVENIMSGSRTQRWMTDKTNDQRPVALTHHEEIRVTAPLHSNTTERTCAVLSESLVPGRYRNGSSPLHALPDSLSFGLTGWMGEDFFLELFKCIYHTNHPAPLARQHA